jgi:DNA-binding NtrC family response regulator
VAQAYSKTVEISFPRSSLTPCLLEDDPEQLDGLSSLVTELGYESVSTSDPEEALKAVRYGRCRLMIANIHASGTEGYEFPDRALRTDPGLHVIVVTGEYTRDSALESIPAAPPTFFPNPSIATA